MEKRLLMFKEFKQFAFKGNVIDLAVGVIIGGAFGKIVTSLVNDLLMPLLGILLGKVNFSDLKYTIPSAIEGGAPAAIMYGAFIQSVVDFLIIALCIFLFVKLISKVRIGAPEPEEAPAEPEPSREEVLLTEIRDLLKESRGQ